MKRIVWVFLGWLALLTTALAAGNNLPSDTSELSNDITTQIPHRNEIIGSWRMGISRLDFGVDGRGTHYFGKNVCVFAYTFTDNVITAAPEMPHSCGNFSFKTSSYYSVANDILVLQDIETKSVSRWERLTKKNENDSPQESIKKVFSNDGFPGNYISINPQTHALIPWRRAHLSGGIWGSNPDPSLSLIYITEGSVVVYTAPGPSMKPGTEQKLPTEFKSVLSHLNDPIPPGQPHTGSAYFALLHKMNDKYTLLPLNYTESDTAHLFTTYPVNHLTSGYDAVLDKYLIYVPGLLFNSVSWDSSIPSWEHFDAWWLNAKNETIEHIVLPAGPWVSDAKLDIILLRGPRNFSCGVDCYRSYAITVENGNIFVSISGRPSAISQSVTGTYKLSKDGTKWEKIKS